MQKIIQADKNSTPRRWCEKTLRRHEHNKVRHKSNFTDQHLRSILRIATTTTNSRVGLVYPRALKHAAREGICAARDAFWDFSNNQHLRHLVYS